MAVWGDDFGRGDRVLTFRLVCQGSVLFSCLRAPELGSSGGATGAIGAGGGHVTVSHLFLGL